MRCIVLVVAICLFSTPLRAYELTELHKIAGVLSKLHEDTKERKVRCYSVFGISRGPSGFVDCERDLSSFLSFVETVHKEVVGISTQKRPMTLAEKTNLKHQLSRITEIADAISKDYRWVFDDRLYEPRALPR